MLLAKSIDQLFEEVKDYDLVMCNDAPLALALNNRLETPRVGTFAITPRQLATDLAIDILKTPIMSDIEVVRKLSRYSKEPIRFVHGEVENFKTIRRYAKNVKQYLRGKKSKDLYEDYVTLPTLEKVMDQIEGMTDPFFTGKRIAVIGSELYDELDKNLNPRPGTFDIIDLFVNDWDYDGYRIPEFRELYNDHQMAENAVEMITKENMGDVAIVFDVNGKIADAVRSELYRRGLSFKNDLSIRDLNKIRDFIEFISRSLDYNISKVSQVRELLQSYGGSLYAKYDQYLISNFKGKVDKRTSELMDIMENIRDYTFGEVCERIEDKDITQVRMLLSQLEITDTKVNAKDTADMIYSVNNFELKHNVQIPNTEKEGVLLVDCNKSVYIDRPVVIYLGLGPEWERDLSDLNLIDYRMKDKIVDDNVVKFQILLQQGTSRTYICNSTKNGKKAKPCIYFEAAEGLRDRIYMENEGKNKKKVFEKFSDLSTCVPGPWYGYNKPGAEKVGFVPLSEANKDYLFSATSYGSFVTCPRQFMLSWLVRTPDESYTEIGIGLHQYTEFRSCYPEKVRELGQDFFVRYINEKCAPLLTPELRELRESKIRSAINEIDTLIGSRGLDKDVNIVAKHRTHENDFFKMIGEEGKGPENNEIVLLDSERFMHGVLDIIKDGVVYDLKTGGAKNPKKIKDPMDLEAESEYGKDLQCLFYLSLMLNEGYDDPSFSFFSSSANEKNDLLGIPRDPDAPFVNIKLISDKENCLRTFFPPILDAKGPNYKKYKPVCDTIMDSVVNYGFDRVLEEKDAVCTMLMNIAGINDVPSNRTNAGTIYNVIADILSPYYVSDNTIYVTMDEIKEFREGVMNAHEQFEKYYFTEFPADDPKMKCKNCKFRDMCIPVEGGDSDE